MDSSSSLNNILCETVNPCQSNNHLLQQQPHHFQQQQTHHNTNLFNSLSGGVENLSPNVSMNAARHFAAAAAATVPSQFYNFSSYQSHLPSPPASAMSTVMQQQISALQPSMSSPAASMQAFMDSSAAISATSKNHNNMDTTSMMSMQMPTGAYPLYDMPMVPYPYLMPTGAASQYTNQFYTG